MYDDQSGNDIMKNKDLAIKAEIEALLESHTPGHNLKAYFENLPDDKLRRTIKIFSSIYPFQLVISDEEFSFITYIFSEKKY